MQAAGTGNKPTPRGEKESINFRPSPNFKHMKKYLKSKFEESHNEQDKPPINANIRNEAGSSTSQIKQETPAATVSQPSTIQPPLPPNPPPDSPVSQIKQEIIDDEYEYNIQGQTNLDQNNPQEQNQAHSPEPEQPPPTGSEPTMCRNFVRGTCKKGSACIFRHEMILSQLDGVYTFCKNFQNRQCTYPRCKFVHATVFEKEHFYRTGYLPAHTVAHLKKPLTQPPPPPPPEEPPAQEIPAYYQTINMNPGVNMTGMSMMGGIPNYMFQSQMQSMNDMYAAGPSTSAAAHMATSLKRGWNETFTSDNLNYNQLDIENPMMKKCKDCDGNEFRYQLHRNKVENMMSTADEMNKKMAHLNAKTQRLWTVLVTLFKPQSGFGGMPPGFGEKEKAIMEQLQMIASTNNRMSFMSEEDSMKSMYGSNPNIQHFLTKMFMSSTDQPQ